MIDEIVKGDSMDLKSNMAQDISGWAIRCEIWDKFDNRIEKASVYAGGTDEQIEITDEINGIFYVHILKDETTDFDDIAKIEITAEVDDKRITILQDSMFFRESRIDWTDPS